MNDNASGSAAVLGAALRLSKEPQPDTPSASPSGAGRSAASFGSRHHLNALSENDRRRIGLYINLDMVGSPNFGRFIQMTQPEGRTSATAGLAQSFAEYFAARNLPVEERTRNERGYGSDDAAFAARGIPTLGLFTGAGSTKSEDHATRFGGSAGQPFDLCYHKVCDTAENVNREVLGQMTDALTHTLRQAGSHAIVPDR